MNKVESTRKGLVKVLDVLCEEKRIGSSDITRISSEMGITEQKLKVNVLYVLVEMGVLSSRNGGYWHSILDIVGVVSYEKFEEASKLYSKKRRNVGDSLSEFVSRFTGSSLSEIFRIDSSSVDNFKEEPIKEIKPTPTEQDLLCQLLDENLVEKFDPFSGGLLTTETRISIFAEKYDLSWKEYED